MVGVAVAGCCSFHLRHQVVIDQVVIVRSCSARRCSVWWLSFGVVVGCLIIDSAPVAGCCSFHLLHQVMIGMVVIGAVCLDYALIGLGVGVSWLASWSPVAARSIFMHQGVIGLMVIESVLRDQGSSTR